MTFPFKILISQLLELFYREKGDPSLPPLLLLHGLWGASDNWLTVAQLLSGRFHVILPDFRNHGHSPHHPQQDYPTLSQDIQQFILQRHFPYPPFIAGHSMGGKALMYLLLTQPSLAAKAAILDTGPQAYTCLPLAKQHARLLKSLQSLPLASCKQRKEVSDLIRQHFPAEEDYQLLMKNIDRKYGEFRWKINASALYRQLSVLLDWPAETFSPYPHPVLFIRAEQSAFLPPSLPDTLLSLFPAAHLLTICQSTHRLHADQPIRLSEILTSWFLD